MSIEEIIKIAHNYGCLYESTLSEMYNEETLLKDIKQQLLIHSVSKSFYCMASNSFDGFTKDKCKKQCDMCKSGQ